MAGDAVGGEDGFAGTSEVAKGGYILKDCNGTPDVILIGTGSEVQYVVEAQKLLAEEGGVIGPVYAVQLSALNSKCSGFRQTLDSQPDFREIACEGK